MATFVLVHGAWHGGWCWPRVAEPLRARGHRVFTPTLTGLGERAHLARPEIDLETHIADVVGLIESEELESVVLCGHSYGGMVVSGVADRLVARVGALVFLDAFVPEDGQSLLSLQPPDRAQRMREAAAKHGGWRVPPFPASHFGVRDGADRAWIDRRCVPHPFRTLDQPARLTGDWRRIKGLHYILAADYANSAFGRFADAARADPTFRVATVPCGHEVMIDEPARLVDLLTEAA
jgi:pimeloyl-ACP methyl ester carboxylesterase